MNFDITPRRAAVLVLGLALGSVVGTLFGQTAGLTVLVFSVVAAGRA